MTPRTVATIVVLSLAVPAFAAPAFRVVASNGPALVIEVEVPEMRRAVVLVDGREMDAVEIPGGSLDRAPGAPELPYLARLVGVHGDDAFVEAVAAEAVEVLRLSIAPAPLRPKRCGGGVPRRSCDPVAYARPGLAPDAWAHLDSQGSMAGQRVARLVVRPVRHDPTTGETLVASRLRLVVHLGTRKDGPARPVAPGMRSLLRSLLLNGDAVAGALPHAPERQVVVVADALRSSVDALVNWRASQGIASEVVSVQAIGDSAAEVKAFLLDLYNGPQRPSHVLLVGDAEAVPYFFGSDGCASDWMYSTLDGDDLYSDMVVSRVSAKTAGDVAVQVAKTMALEAGTGFADGGAWLARATLVSSSEGEGASNDDARCDALAAEFEAYGYETVDRLYHSSGTDTAAAISTAISDGRGVLAYLGHGSGTAWDTTVPPFGVDHVASLDNPGLYPFVMDVSCLNGRFDAPADCLAEAFVKAGEPEAGRGAVAMYSSSSDTTWDPPAEMAAGVFDGLLLAGQHRLGAALAYGRGRLVEKNGATVETELVFQQYVLFGDGLLLLRTRPPVPLDLELPAALPAGATDLSVRVTTGGAAVGDALVAVWGAGGPPVATYTGADGLACFSLPPVQPGELHVVATAFDALPASRKVTVAPTGCGVLHVAPDVVGCQGDIDIFVWDTDLDVDPTTPDSAGVKAFLDEGSAVALALVETGPSTGLLTGRIAVAAIGATHGSTIEVTYEDAACDGAASTVSGAVRVDCQGPVISGVAVDHLAPTSARVSFVTDEPATARVEAWANGAARVWSGPLTASHVAPLSGLDPATHYELAILATDEAGNETAEAQWGFETPECAPDCAGRACGDDGCGGSCGSCLPDQECEDGECTGGAGCVPRLDPGWPGAKCEQCVCGLDTYCCEWGVWDAQCVTECEQMCGGCGPAEPPGEAQDSPADGPPEGLAETGHDQGAEPSHEAEPEQEAAGEEAGWPLEGALPDLIPEAGGDPGPEPDPVPESQAEPPAGDGAGAGPEHEAPGGCGATPPGPSSWSVPLLLGPVLLRLLGCRRWARSSRSFPGCWSWPSRAGRLDHRLLPPPATSGPSHRSGSPA